MTREMKPIVMPNPEEGVLKRDNLPRRVIRRFVEIAESLNPRSAVNNDSGLSEEEREYRRKNPSLPRGIFGH
jgi:hypothetical protein